MGRKWGGAAVGGSVPTGSPSNTMWPRPQMFSPNYPKFLGVMVKISIALYGDPEGAYVMKFWQLYLGPFPRKKIKRFDEYCRFLKLHEFSPIKKHRRGPPMMVPKIIQIG